MSEIKTPPRPVLLTGASGELGRMLARELAAAGFVLKLSDIAPFPDALPPGARFTQCDLANGVDVLRSAEGCGTILHFGGVSIERPFDEVLGPNIVGLYNIYEAARHERARVIFASTNHTIGFHERSEPLDDDCQFIPDGYYGLSKAYGELMGRTYWFKHGVENVNLRIGSCRPAPGNARMLATYLSYPDIVGLCVRATLAEKTGCAVVWGASDNSRTFWRRDARDSIGWAPRDSADPFTAALAGRVSGDPVEERYQGGPYAAIDYTRTEPPPGKLFR